MINQSWDIILDNILSTFSADTGTIHKLNQEDKMLYLVIASPNMPEKVLEQISKIPLGKGIAGVTALKKEPVSICNLQQDTKGIAIERAKTTKADGTICVPIFDKEHEVVGTLGIASNVQRSFTDKEITELSSMGAELVDKLKGSINNLRSPLKSQ